MNYIFILPHTTDFSTEIEIYSETKYLNSHMTKVNKVSFVKLFSLM